MIYRYEARPRTRKALVGIGMYFLGLLLLRLWFDVADGIVAVALLVSLPAIYDLARNTQSTFVIDPHTMRWQTGRQEAQIALKSVARVRFDTRLDLSVKMTVILDTGRKIRVPVTSTPPIPEIEHALDSLNLKHERHHFTLLG